MLVTINPTRGPSSPGCHSTWRSSAGGHPRPRGAGCALEAPGSSGGAAGVRMSKSTKSTPLRAGLQTPMPALSMRTSTIRSDSIEAKIRYTVQHIRRLRRRAQRHPCDETAYQRAHYLHRRNRFSPRRRQDSRICFGQSGSTQSGRNPLPVLSDLREDPCLADHH